ncbi:hypothetical protein M419DRAFT_125190 [Trichoderma reesei RUT C-30]|uniref:Uncharacterized protein n=1 Tax=Hypocrea jecorina (strain ATCC 56765 / BCRC 32924 / NRRL 11460 / Rut C-30) TaxID=1344414 RepID=A0A024RZY9_HYPJR|nr:hypothetical protein M419DRAFT_125190 [Trichoderma reesei RUT C-30]
MFQSLQTVGQIHPAADQSWFRDHQMARVRLRSISITFNVERARLHHAFVVSRQAAATDCLPARPPEAVMTGLPISIFPQR